MLSERDRQRLTGVHPRLVAAIETIFAAMHDRGTPMFVVSGVRTEQQQILLYQQGRTTTGPGVDATHPLGHTVTNKTGAAGSRSDHQVEADGYGHAVDCAFLPTKDKPDAWGAYWPWQQFGADLEAAGMQWGGRWKQPADLDHAQYVAPSAPVTPRPQAV